MMGSKNTDIHEIKFYKILASEGKYKNNNVCGGKSKQGRSFRDKEGINR